MSLHNSAGTLPVEDRRYDFLRRPKLEVIASVCESHGRDSKSCRGHPGSKVQPEEDSGGGLREEDDDCCLRHSRHQD
jgi:hypothetical protein